MRDLVSDGSAPTQDSPPLQFQGREALEARVEKAESELATTQGRLAIMASRANAIAADRNKALSESVHDRQARDTAIRERDEALAMRDEMQKAVRIAHGNTERDYQRANEAEAKLTACDELVEGGVVNPSPPNAVWVRADELAAILHD